MSGRGIFTTISIRDGKPFLWEKHWSRLTSTAKKIGIDLSNFSEAAVKAALACKLERDAIQNGRAKIAFNDERPSRLWPSLPSPEANTSFEIVTGPIRELPENFRVGISPFPVNSLAPTSGLKTSNYLEPTLCFEAAIAAGFDEAIRLNEQRRVTGACFANVFWLKDNTLFTPEISTGGLAGTTREFVVEKLDVREVTAEIDELERADAVFLTSAGIGIVRAASLAETVFRPLDHPILDLIEGWA